jgi:hypothetical protein
MTPATQTIGRPLLDQLRAQLDTESDARQEAHALATATEASVIRYRTILDANIGRVAIAAPPSVEEALAARVRLPHLEVALAEQMLAALEHDRRAAAAQQALRDALDAQYQAELVPLVRTAAAALRKAMAAMAEIHERQERHATETGRAFCDPAYMAVLLPGDNLASAWLAAQTSHLDE